MTLTSKREIRDVKRLPTKIEVSALKELRALAKPLVTSLKKDK